MLLVRGFTDFWPHYTRAKFARDSNGMKPPVRGTNGSRFGINRLQRGGQAPLEDCAWSCLDGHGAQCRRRGGTVAYLDARSDVPLVNQGLLDGPSLVEQAFDGPAKQSGMR
jgi:hypothetical protein